VAGFVDGRLTAIVALHGAGGHRVCVDVAAVGEVDGRVGFTVGNGGGEGAFAEDATGEVGLEVEIEGAVGALAEGLFHRRVGVAAADGPGIIGSPSDVDEVEFDIVGVVRVVERVELCFGHVVGDAGFCGFFGDNVEYDVNGDGLCVAGCQGGTGGGGARVCVAMERLNCLDKVVRGMRSVCATVEWSSVTCRGQESP